MIHYRDMTFCIAYGDTCDNAHCQRAVTDKVASDAKAWAERSGLDTVPMSIADLSKGCPDIVPASLPNTVKVSR